MSSVQDIPSFEVPLTQPSLVLAATERSTLIARIKQQLKDQDAVLVAHYYTDPELQALAEATGGCVADSLEMARFGQAHPAETLVVAGVYFMGETAKILSPEKRILMPTLDATCSLDLGCPAPQFSEFCAQHPDRTVVVYANTSAAVKALADWTVTSRIGLDIVRHLDQQGDKILWAPDRYLGQYIQSRTQADMVLWQGSCVVHEEFKANALEQLKKQHPDAAILVHPESPAEVIALADVVGSTSTLIEAAHNLPNPTCIVATDRGIFYKMQQAAPHKTFIEAPTGGVGGSCRSCGHCPWMAMNHLQTLAQCLDSGDNEVQLSAELIDKARISVDRMMHFAQSH